MDTIQDIKNRLQSVLDHVVETTSDDDEGAHMYCAELQYVIDACNLPGATVETVRLAAIEMSINLETGR